jgi:hypothetical protein
MADTRKAAETNLRNAFETTLSGTLGATDTTLNLTSTTGLTSPIYLVIDPDSSTSREYIFIDGTINASSAAMSTVDNRYLTGSAAGSGLSHASGTKVRVSPMAQMFEDIWDAVGKVIDGTWSSAQAGEVVFNVTDAAVNVAADSIFFRDADGNNITKRETIADFVDAIDGTGLTASSGVLNIDSTVVTESSTDTLTNKTLGAVTLSGAVTGGDQTISAAVLKDYAETDQDVTSAAALSIDLANGNTGSVTLAHSVTDIDFLNVPAAGISTFTLIVTQDGTGSRTMAINKTTVNGQAETAGKTAGGAGLTLSTAAASIDIVTFIFKDASTTVFIVPQLAFA